MNNFEKRGKRLEINKIRVSQNSNGQFRATIPRYLADSIGIKKGSILIFDKQENYLIICLE